MLSILSFSLIISLLIAPVPSLGEPYSPPYTADIIIVIDDLIGSHSTPDPDPCGSVDLAPYFTLSPNPCSSRVELLLDPLDGEIQELNVFDSAGNHKASTTQSEGIWYLPTLSPGLYRLEVLTNKGCSSRLMSVL